MRGNRIQGRPPRDKLDSGWASTQLMVWGTQGVMGSAFACQGSQGTPPELGNCSSSSRSVARPPTTMYWSVCHLTRGKDSCVSFALQFPRRSTGGTRVWARDCVVAQYPGGALPRRRCAPPLSAVAGQVDEGHSLVDLQLRLKPRIPFRHFKSKPRIYGLSDLITTRFGPTDRDPTVENAYRFTMCSI